jgi:hypothetical protein
LVNDKLAVVISHSKTDVFIRNIDISILTNAKVVKTNSIPSKYYNHSSYLQHSVMKDNKLFFLQHKENLIIIDPESLEFTRPVIKITNKFVDDSEFGIFKDLQTN